MKTYSLIFIFLFLFLFQFSQAQEHYLGIKAAHQSRRFVELGIGYAYTPFETKDDMIPSLIISPTISVEFNYGNQKRILGKKVSFEAHYYFVGTRMNIVQYTAGSESDLRFRPEAGISLFGIVNCFYGYNFKLSNEQIAEIQPHNFSFAINIPLKRLK